MVSLQTRRAASAPKLDILEFQLLGFVPTLAQAIVLGCKKRFLLVSGGEGSGKSMLAKAYLEIRCFEPEQPGLYWLVGADYAQVTKEFEYLKEDFSQLRLLKEATNRVDPGYMVLMDGTRIETRSAKDPMKLTRDSPNGILACEAGQLSLETYFRLQSRVGRSRGWIFMCGTLEDSLGWYPALKQAWAYGTPDAQSFSLPTWSNTYLFPGGREDAEILRVERATSDHYFQERYAGEVVPPKGLVFPEFRPDIHIRDVEWAGEYEPVYIWEDPGYGSESAHALEIAQIIDGQVQVFDEIYLQGLITRDVIQLARSRPWWKSPKMLVSDPHYKDQHHSMTSVSEVWAAETGLVAGGDRVHVNPGIERLKSFLKPDPFTGVPRIVFNPKCQGIISEFGAGLNPFDGQAHPYSWKVDERSGLVVGETPVDRFNHGLKAVIYGLITLYGYARELQSSVIKVRRY